MKARFANLLFLLVPVCLAGCVSAKSDLYPPPLEGDQSLAAVFTLVGRAPPFPVTVSNPTIYVVSNGWHAGLILRRSDVDTNLWPELNQIPMTEYVEVGWGNEGFYMAKHITPGLILGALIPSASVLHIAGFNGDIETIFQNADLVSIDLSKDGLAEMCRFIHASYVLDGAGQPARLGPGLYGESEFYRAHGKYYFPNTCNVWTANALRSAGCPITPAYASTAQNLVFQARRIGNVPPFLPLQLEQFANPQLRSDLQQVSFPAILEKPR